MHSNFYTLYYPVWAVKSDHYRVFLTFEKFAQRFFLRCFTRFDVLSYDYDEAITLGVARSLLTAY